MLSSCDGTFVGATNRSNIGTVDLATLRDLRRARGLSLRKVQEETGVFFPYLSEIERGVRKPTREELVALSVFYGVDPDGWQELLVHVNPAA